VKTCSYCGRENDDIRQHCFECGTELVVSAPVEEPAVSAEPCACVFCNATNPAGRSECRQCGNALVISDHPAEDSFRPDPEADELPDLGLDYELEQGLSYPNWEAMWQRVNSSVPRSGWDAVCRKAAREWLRQLCRDLGGNYRNYESAKFFLMCAEGRSVSQALLDYAEKSQAAISGQIGNLGKHEVFGKEILLVFSDDDDYYTYISHFYPDGTHNLSMGVFITAGGYGHIAMPFTFVFATKAIVTHELVHNSLFHLRVPTWLNEGLAQRIERSLANRGFKLDPDQVDRHREFWNEASIQEFWAGTSFDKPGDSTELSYSLGEILVELLADDYPAFLDFVSEADWRDGGQDAAVRLLGKDLGEVAGGFLGPGDWRPNRKKLSDLFERPRDSAGDNPDDPDSPDKQAKIP
jgi:hypothetical protein